MYTDLSFWGQNGFFWGGDPPPPSSTPQPCWRLRLLAPSSLLTEVVMGDESDGDDDKDGFDK